MRGSRNILVGCVAVLLLLGAGTAQAEVVAGILKCQVSGGLSLVVGSRRDVLCVYRPNGPGSKQYLLGTINRLGIALGLRFAGTLMWNVHSELHDVRTMEGSFTGVGADAKFFEGPNQDVLVGGEGGRVYLRPLTAGGPTGFEVSAGIGNLNLVRTTSSRLFEELDDDDIN